MTIDDLVLCTMAGGSAIAMDILWIGRSADHLLENMADIKFRLANADLIRFQQDSRFMPDSFYITDKGIERVKELLNGTT